MLRATTLTSAERMFSAGMRVSRAARSGAARNRPPRQPRRPLPRPARRLPAACGTLPRCHAGVLPAYATAAGAIDIAATARSYAAWATAAMPKPRYTNTAANTMPAPVRKANVSQASGSPVGPR